ncbi:uncharacterized protein [Palaemon carinicauda]|uniref:uncharacterized protein n=1 Tax=Palaemon carinicauda TaxID=392227 RepID=UPI0035B5A80C
MMLIVIFAYGILFQTEAFQISSNNTDSSDGPSLVSTLRVETEETTSYTSYPQREDDPMSNITSNIHPDVLNSFFDVSIALPTETNATIFTNTNNSSSYETDTSLFRQNNATVFPEDDSTETSTIVSPDDSTPVSPDDNTPVSPDDSTIESPDDSTTVSPDDSTTVSLDDSTTVSRDDSTTVSRDDSTTASLNDSTTVSPDDSTTVSRSIITTGFPEHNFTVSLEISTTEFQEMNMTVFPDNIPTEAPNVTDSLTSEGGTEHPFSKCPDIGRPQVAGSVVMCYCEGNEIYVSGKCQVYDGAIVIPVQHDFIKTKEENFLSYDVMVQDVKCDTSKHSYMNFTRNQFHIRPRGDVVLLKEAGKLEGQRINNYCIFHHFDKYDQLTWTMKACVPIPSIPRCCPPGQAMKEGKCQEASTPDILKPPISAKPFSGDIDWRNITEFESPVKCDSKDESLITIALGHKQSHLVSLADGVENGWVPMQAIKRRVYNKCPEYCVDGINNSEGSVDYFTSFCYKDPKETHEKACANATCLRKCCKKGYSMDQNRYSCVPDPNSTFIPSTVMGVTNYNMLIGYPLCAPISKVEEKVRVYGKGNLILRDRELTSTDFCVDTFLDNEQRHQSALASLTETSLWLKVRPYIFPICNVICLIFLMITIVCHLLVPTSLANGGLYQLCYLIALSIACITSFCVHVIPDVCVNTATAIQFGFLTTFFWLNVMCFEIWRKIRKLTKYRPSKSYSNKYYMMYGWGIPFCICMITVLTQKHFPEKMWEFTEVRYTELQCLLADHTALLIYFYGPIAVLFLFNCVFLVNTCINYKIMLQNHKETTYDLKVLGAGVTSEQHNLPLRQITDHVHAFNLKFKLFVIMTSCWVISLVMAVLPWKTPPLQLWPYTDTLNSLQGLFLFICFLLNRNKRKHLEKKFPRLFQWIRKFNPLPAYMKWLQNIVNPTLYYLTSSISVQFLNSTAIGTLTTSIQSLIPSSAPFKLSSSSSSSEAQSYASLDNPDEGIVVLSQSSLRGTDNVQDPGNHPFKIPKVRRSLQIRLADR